VTQRQWDTATVPHDKWLAPTGRVIEMLGEHKQYINRNGRDMPEIRNWKWKG